jgi:ribose transport system permease protein
MSDGTVEPGGRGQAPQATSATLTQRLAAGSWATWALPLALLGLAVIFTLTSEFFLTQRNLINILQQSSVTAIAAAGATMVFISGGIDISQSAIMAMAGIVTVLFIVDAGVPDLLAIVLALLAGLGFGLINGLLAERVRIPAFIATLGTALVIRGVGFTITGGVSTGLGQVYGDVLKWLGRGFIGPIPVSVMMTLVVYIIVALIMARTAWGTHTYAIGSNERAARMSGIRVHRHRIGVYAVAAGLAALAGVVSSGRIASAAPNALVGAEFDIITAVVLGGTSIYGGRGNVLRTLLAAIFLVTLTNGLVMLNVPTFWQQIATGSVLLVALALDRIRSES